MLSFKTKANLVDKKHGIHSATKTQGEKSPQFEIILRVSRNDVAMATLRTRSQIWRKKKVTLKRVVDDRYAPGRSRPHYSKYLSDRFGTECSERCRYFYKAFKRNFDVSETTLIRFSLTYR